MSKKMCEQVQAMLQKSNNKQDFLRRVASRLLEVKGTPPLTGRELAELVLMALPEPTQTTQKPMALRGQCSIWKPDMKTLVEKAHEEALLADKAWAEEQAMNQLVGPGYTQEEACIMRDLEIERALGLSPEKLAEMTESEKDDRMAEINDQRYSMDPRDIIF